MIPLQLAKYLKNEKHYIPWAMARAKLDCMTMMIQDKKIKKGYKVCCFVSPAGAFSQQFKAVGFLKYKVLICPFLLY